MPNNDILKAIADNPTVLNALKELLLKQFESTHINLELSDEQIGQITRSKLLGIEKVEAAFKEISKYKTPEPRPERINRGM